MEKAHASVTVGYFLVKQNSKPGEYTNEGVKVAEEKLWAAWQACTGEQLQHNPQNDISGLQIKHTFVILQCVQQFP